MKCSVASPGKAPKTGSKRTPGARSAPQTRSPQAALHKELIHPVADRVIRVELEGVDGDGHQGLAQE